MAADYVVKAGSVPGPLVIGLSYSDATVPNLLTPGTTARFRMRPYREDPAVVAGACIILSGTSVGYQFGPTELVGLGGVYEGEVSVEWLDGRKETFPADAERPYFIIVIEPQIEE